MVGPGISAWGCWNFLAGERSFSDRCVSYKFLMGLMTRYFVLSRVPIYLGYSALIFSVWPGLSHNWVPNRGSEKSCYNGKLNVGND